MKFTMGHAAHPTPSVTRLLTVEGIKVIRILAGLIFCCTFKAYRAHRITSNADVYCFLLSKTLFSLMKCRAVILNFRNAIGYVTPRIKNSIRYFML